MNHDVELKALRKVAADYRRRAETEPEMTETLLKIAQEMEASVRKLTDA